jgi:NOL1/NOP2/fmu family ribosome biogenesis protein
MTPNQAEKCIRCRPHRQHTGGFFVVHLIKTKSLPWNNEKIQASYNAQFNPSPAIQSSVKQYLKLFFGIITTKHHYFIEVNNTIYLTTPLVEKILPYLRCEKVGIAVLKKTKHSFRPLHGLAVTLGHLADKHIIELTADQTQRYTQLETIPLEDIEDTLADASDDFPYRILSHQWLPISISKITDTILKNKFIRVG